MQQSLVTAQQRGLLLVRSARSGIPRWNLLRPKMEDGKVSLSRIETRRAG